MELCPGRTFFSESGNPEVTVGVPFITKKIDAGGKKRDPCQTSPKKSSKICAICGATRGPCSARSRAAIPTCGSASRICSKSPTAFHQKATSAFNCFTCSTMSGLAPASMTTTAESDLSDLSVEARLQALPLSERQILLLTTLEGFSVQDASQILGIPHEAGRRSAGLRLVFGQRADGDLDSRDRGRAGHRARYRRTGPRHGPFGHRHRVEPDRGRAPGAEEPAGPGPRRHRPWAGRLRPDGGEGDPRIR